MKKKILILPLIAAIAGGHYFIWHKQTSELAQGLTAQINKINESMKDELNISYEEQKLSGYPSKSVVIFTKPVVKFVAQEGGSILINEDISFSANLLGNKVEAKANGTIDINDSSKTYQFISENGVGCSLESSKSIVELIVNPPEVATTEDVVKNFRSLNCLAEKIKLSEGETEVMNAKLYGFGVNASPSGENKLLDFNVRVEDLESFGTIGSTYSTFFTDSNWIQYPNLGKQNFVISGGAVIDEKQPTKFQFNLRELKTSNDLYAIDLPVEIDNSNGIKISHNGLLKFDGKFDAANIELAKSAFSAIEEGKLNDNLLQNFAEKIKSGAVSSDDVSNIVPQLNKYGSIKTYANFTVNPDLMSGKAENIGFSTDLFALKINGDVKMGDASIVITCEKCDVMVDKFTNYANDWTKFLFAVGEVSNGTAFSDEAKQAINKLAHDYDADENAENITWKIEQKGAEISVSGKRADEFMVRINAEILPLIPIFSGL